MTVIQNAVTTKESILLSEVSDIQIGPQSAPNLQCAYTCPMNNLTNLYTTLPTCKKCAQVLMKQLIKHEDAGQIKHVYVSLVESVHVC